MRSTESRETGEYISVFLMISGGIAWVFLIVGALDWVHDRIRDPSPEPSPAPHLVLDRFGPYMCITRENSTHFQCFPLEKDECQ